MGQTEKYNVKAGDRYGRLVVLRENTEYKHSFARVNYTRFVDVRCDCGVEFTTRLLALVNGGTRSCGCIRKELVRKLKGGREPRVLYMYDGKMRSLHELSEILHIDVTTLYARHIRHAGDIDEITKPLKFKRK